MKEIKERTPEQETAAQRYSQWMVQCSQRRSWIQEANVEWRKRVAARKEAMAQWDKHVEEARVEYQRRSATPLPPK
jgi:hypothetical protein